MYWHYSYVPQILLSFIILFSAKSLTNSLANSLAKNLAESLGSDYMHDSQRDSRRDSFFYAGNWYLVLPYWASS